MVLKVLCIPGGCLGFLPSTVLVLLRFWLVVEPTHLKNMLVKLEIFPMFRGENKKYLKPPPRYNFVEQTRRDGLIDGNTSRTGEYQDHENLVQLFPTHSINFIKYNKFHPIWIYRSIFSWETLYQQGSLQNIPNNAVFFHRNPENKTLIPPKHESHCVIHPMKFHPLLTGTFAVSFREQVPLQYQPKLHDWLKVNPSNYHFHFHWLIHHKNGQPFTAPKYIPRHPWDGQVYVPTWNSP